MATDTTGFRSLVQQIQERDHSPEPQASERPRGPSREVREAREPRRDLPRRTRNGRNDGMGATFSDATKTSAASTLLERRWL
jgi:hypothetical protein